MYIKESIHSITLSVWALTALFNDDVSSYLMMIWNYLSSLKSNTLML